MDKGKRTLLLIAAVCIAPVIASYSAYYLLPVTRTTNYGELLSPAPGGEIRGVRPDGTSFSLEAQRGKWVLLVADSGACAEGCQKKLYATRQARKMQGKEQLRVTRVFLALDAAASPPELAAAHPDLVVARVERGAVSWLPAPRGVEGHIFLIDPLGNVILRYDGDPDIKSLNKDLARLLKASRVG